MSVIAGATRPVHRARPWRPAAVRAFVSILALTLAATGMPSLSVWASEGHDLTGPGPYEVDVREVSVPRTRGGEGSFEARAYVPSPPMPGVALSPIPVLAFGHGYQATVDDYESTLAHLASWGMVVIAPRSAGGLFPDHAAFADDLLSALDWVVGQAGRQGSDWPGGPVDPTALGLSGHSMGGGAALLAAARDPSIRAVATLAAAETDPSAIDAAARIAAAALFLAASDDAITPIDRHQRPMFEAKATGPAQLRTIVGGSHCGFLDLETLILSLVCDEAAIGAEAQRRLTRSILAGWLCHELVADRSMATLAWPESSDGATLVESR